MLCKTYVRIPSCTMCLFQRGYVLQWKIAALQFSSKSLNANHSSSLCKRIPRLGHYCWNDRSLPIFSSAASFAHDSTSKQRPALSQFWMRCLLLVCARQWEGSSVDRVKYLSYHPPPRLVYGVWWDTFPKGNQGFPLSKGDMDTRWLKTNKHSLYCSSFRCL